MKSESGGWTLASALAAIRKLWWLILGCALAGGAVGVAVAVTTTPQYQSTASLYFAVNQVNSANDLNQGSNYTQGQMLSFAQLATSSRVLNLVIDDLGLETTSRDLSHNIHISIPQDTSILNVQAMSTDPDMAAEIANSVSHQLTEVVDEIGPTSTDGAASISASVIDEAVVPTYQALPNKPRDTALATALGLMVGLLAAFAVTLADTRVRNEASLALVTEVPLLGTITRGPRRSDIGLVAARDPHSHIAEDFRRVQSALSFANVDGTARRLLVTSTSPGEGKSTIAANLAVTLAELGEDALLVDADLRRPRVGEIFGLDQTVGLTDVVRSSITLDEAVTPWRENGPDLLLSGERPPNAATILTSNAFSDILHEATSQHDILLVDSPPVLSVADPNLLAPLVDGVVIVVDASRTRRAQLRASIQTLEGAGAKILGVVLNKVKMPRGRPTYYTTHTTDTHGRTRTRAGRS